MGLLKVGEKVPLVTFPKAVPFFVTGYNSRGMRFPGSSSPTRTLPEGVFFSFTKASLPRKSPLSNLTAHDNPASKGLVFSSISWP